MATPFEQAEMQIQLMGPDGILSLSGLDLTELPAIPENTKIIYCDNNKLTSLPKLPPNLVKLNCNDNQLTSLPKLPSTLTNLACGNNQLTSLPKLPEGLEELYCVNNQLTTFPLLPTTLEMLDCDTNPFIQPIQDIIDDNLSDLDELVRQVNNYLLRERARNIVSLQHLNASSRNPQQQPSIINVIHPQSGVGSIIGSFLTNETGNYNQQVAKIRGKINEGGYRKRKTHKKRANKKKRSSRKH